MPIVIVLIVFFWLGADVLNMGAVLLLYLIASRRAGRMSGNLVEELRD